jgi:hypothetical protein
MNRRQLLLAAASAAALTAVACPAIAADVAASLRITVAPPAPRAEVIPAGPNFSAYWIPGYWEWTGHDYRWIGGRWEPARPGMAYQQAYWVNQNGYWEFHPGEWVTVEPAPPAAMAATTSQVITVAPPPPRVEVIPPAPGPSYVWIDGFWSWGGVRYVWNPGYWSGVRVGYVWAPAHWVHHGPGWRMTGGYWHRR